MRLINTIRVVGVLGVVSLGTMAMAQKGGGGGGGGGGISSHPISAPSAPTSNPSPTTTNQPSYNSTTNIYNPYALNGYPYGMDIYSIDASSNIAQQARLRAAEQYRKLNSDMDKLMNLTKQLKMGVSDQPAGQIPSDLVKKAGEIEKLAKSMQSQVKG